MPANVLSFVLLSVAVAPAWGSDLCPRWERANIIDAILHSNGTIEDRAAKEMYPPGTYWSEMVDGRTYIYGCPCKLGKPCLRKCCDWNQMMDNDTLECIPNEGKSPEWFRPNISANSTFQMLQIEYGYFGLAYGNYCFGYLLEPDEYPEDQFYINITDGTLSIPIAKKFSLDASSYCLDYMENFNVYLPYVCFRQIDLVIPDEICDTVRYTVYPLGMAISIIFLIISLVVYATTTELRNLHGRCLMCHIFSLLVAYLFLAIVQSAGGGLSDGSCTAFGFVIYFALLCSFFWLNIMCIDIYITFSSFTPPRVHSSEKKKFLSYVVYAWGIPFVIILVTAIMEFHPGISDDFMKPEFKATCWFRKYSSRLAYFIAPVGVLVFCNVVLFILTAFNIHKVNRETSILHRGNSTKNKEDKNRMKLYIKLSIVMGVSWILEIVSYLIGGSKCIWLFTDTVNTLQGVFIFLIFVWKKNVKELMKKRLRSVINRLKKPSPEIQETQEEDTERSTSKSGDTASTNLPSLELQNKNASP